MVCIGKIPLSAKGITDEITYNHPIDICSADMKIHISHVAQDTSVYLLCGLGV